MHSPLADNMRESGVMVPTTDTREFRVTIQDTDTWDLCGGQRTSRHLTTDRGTLLAAVTSGLSYFARS